MSAPIVDGGNASSTYPAGPVTSTPSGPVYAPDAATYATRTPYLTAVEFTEAGTGVDVGQLVPQGTTGDQTAALTRVIGRASAWADSLTYKVLAATADIQAGRYPVRADGTITVPVRFAPVTTVTAVSVGDSPWAMTPLTDLSRVAITSRSTVMLAAPGWTYRPRFVQLTYVNGWPCTTLAASALAGATQLTVANPLGIMPGSPLTVDDGSTTEQVTVSAAYTPGTNPVLLATPLTQAHSAGAACNNLPPDIKQAVVLLTAALIKTRGDSAFVMASIGAEPDTQAVTQAGGSADLARAKELLAPYRRAA